MKPFCEFNIDVAFEDKVAEMHEINNKYIVGLIKNSNKYMYE